MSSTEIVALLQSDDKAAMKILFQEYYQKICNSIHRIIKDRAAVEDIAQDVFIKIWEKRHQINIKTSIQSYLHRMAFNEAISYIRKNKKHNHEEITPLADRIIDSSEQQLMANELDQHISSAINTLPPRCRIIFQMSRFEELSYKEIAAKLDISVKTVENQMGKALKIMRELMLPYMKPDM